MSDSNQTEWKMVIVSDWNVLCRKITKKVSFCRENLAMCPAEKDFLAKATWLSPKDKPAKFQSCTIFVAWVSFFLKKVGWRWWTDVFRSTKHFLAALLTIICCCYNVTDAGIRLQLWVSQLRAGRSSGVYFSAFPHDPVGTFQVLAGLLCTCKTTAIGHARLGTGARIRARLYSRLQLRWFRVPVFQHTFGWSKTPADHPEVYRGPVAQKPS